jgi:hypothetical protein
VLMAKTTKNAGYVFVQDLIVPCKMNCKKRF